MTTPTKIRSGESHERSNEKTTAMTLVPTSAPSITASAALVVTRFLPTNEATIRHVAVLDCTMLVTPSPAMTARKRLTKLAASTRRRFSPKTRSMPVRTMCVPQTSRAIAARRLRSESIARRRPSVPGQRVGLDVGEALHRFLDAFLVAQPRVLDAAERRQLETVARHLADVDGADLELGDEPCDVVEPVGADRRRQAVCGAVGDPDRLVDVGEGHDRRHRAERFL